MACSARCSSRGTDEGRSDTAPIKENQPLHTRQVEKTGSTASMAREEGWEFFRRGVSRRCHWCEPYGIFEELTQDNYPACPRQPRRGLLRRKRSRWITCRELPEATNTLIPGVHGSHLSCHPSPHASAATVEEHQPLH
jgi:hypothetical protein